MPDWLRDYDGNAAELGLVDTFCLVVAMAEAEEVAEAMRMAMAADNIEPSGWLRERETDG